MNNDNKTPFERLEYMRKYYKTDKYRKWYQEYRKKNKEKYQEYYKKAYLKRKEKIKA